MKPRAGQATDPQPPPAPTDSFKEESEALRAVCEALMPLSDEARYRLIGFVRSYFRVGGF